MASKPECGVMAANAHSETMSLPASPDDVAEAHSRKAHLPPGTLVYTGAHRDRKTVITVFDYGPERLEERTLDDAGTCREYKDPASVSWINLDGLADIEAVETIGRDFGIHPLVLEDILNTTQRPKCEDYGDYLFIVVKMLGLSPDENRIVAEQVSFILGRNFVITFQEYPGDVFGPVRHRLRHGKGQVRKMGADYLAYALIDGIVDNYFVILETFGEEAETLENDLVDSADESIRHRIHSLKRRMISLRRSIWPLREAVSAMERSESALIAKRTRIYVRDLYDHTIQIIDTVESLRDTAGGMLDIYLSAISNRMNSVMKVLTIIATIFIPLTFVAGVYGMNFQNMPELNYPWAYPLVLLIMLLIALGMVSFFKKKRWI